MRCSNVRSCLVKANVLSGSELEVAPVWRTGDLKLDDRPAFDLNCDMGVDFGVLEEVEASGLKALCGVEGPFEVSIGDLNCSLAFLFAMRPPICSSSTEDDGPQRTDHIRA